MKIQTIRKIVCMIATLIILSVLIPVQIFAAESVDVDQIPCNACMLVDAKSGFVLYKSETYQEQIAPASTTKILTAILALENSNLEETVTVGAEVSTFGEKSSRMGLVSGETVTMKDLLYGMMLKSGNDAAAAVAVHLGGSIEGFAEMMNEKAQEIGMEHSHFVNPHGLDNEEHYVTVEDMAKLAVYAVKNETLTDIAATTTYTVPATNKSEERVLNSTNKLIYKPETDAETYLYEYATGLKTGSTMNGGGCIVATAKKDDQSLIALVYGDPTTGGVNRWKIATYLFEYGFSNFRTSELSDFAKELPIQGVVNGALQEDGSEGQSFVALTPVIPEGTVITVDISDTSDSELTCNYVAPEEGLYAPIYSGDSAGKVIYYYGEEKVGEFEVVAAEDVMSKDSKSKDPISSIDPIDIGKKDNTDPEHLKILWIWIVIPVGVIAFLLIMFFLRRRKMAQKRRLRSGHLAIRRKTMYSANNRTNIGNRNHYDNRIDRYPRR